MLDRTAPTAILADLKRQRAELGETIAKLHEARDRLRQAEAAEATALAAIGELGRAEVAAMAEWARTGCETPPPAIDVDKRAELTRSLALAQARAEAARAAGGGVDVQIREVTARSAELARRIYVSAVDALLEQYRSERIELDEVAAATRKRVAGTFAAIGFLRSIAIADRDAAEAKGLPPDMAIFRLLERLGEVPPPDFAPTNGEVDAALPIWAARFEELAR